MVSLFLLLDCNLSYIVHLFAGLHELTSASARTLLKLASSVRVLLKPYGDTLSVSQSGKNIDWSKQSYAVPTSMRKAKTFLEDEYLKSIVAASDNEYFFNICIIIARGMQELFFYKKNPRGSKECLSVNGVTSLVH